MYLFYRYNPKTCAISDRVTTDSNLNKATLIDAEKMVEFLFTFKYFAIYMFALEKNLQNNLFDFAILV